MDLTKFSNEEESDILQGEQLSLLIDFGKEVIRIMSSAKDRQTADALIEHLKKLYFVGYEEDKKKGVARQVEQLIDLSRKTFKVRWGPRGAELEVT